MQMIRIWSILLFIGLNQILMTYSAPLILQRRGRPQKGVRVNGKNFSGSGTFYDVEVGSGSCGDYDSSADLVVAINKAQMANGITNYKKKKKFIKLLLL